MIEIIALKIFHRNLLSPTANLYFYNFFLQLHY